MHRYLKAWGTGWGRNPSGCFFVEASFVLFCFPFMGGDIRLSEEIDRYRGMKVTFPHPLSRGYNPESVTVATLFCKMEIPCGLACQALLGLPAHKGILSSHSSRMQFRKSWDPEPIKTRSLHGTALSSHLSLEPGHGFRFLCPGCF